jgi:ubiquinone/menaquinone biosynthesis C-methylase UbiE
MNEQAVDLEAVKQVQQKVWSEGDFSMVAGTVLIVGEELCESVDILPGERVLDVACGSGNATLPAARRAWGNTVGVDYVPELLERGRERAAAERLEVEFVEGDAENLPFEDASFDVVVSTFGAMFAPNQQKAADELLRVCKPGGRIGMANWTPDGYVGQMFGTTVKHAPPPPGVQPPILWGTEDRLHELFGDGISDLQIEPKDCVFRFHSADHWLEFFRRYFGPTKVAFERVGEEGEQALTSDLKELIARFNTAGDRAMRVPSQYLEVVATRA